MPPAVSALTKVSSVRIIPTPTPSVNSSQHGASAPRVTNNVSTSQQASQNSPSVPDPPKPNKSPVEVDNSIANQQRHQPVQQQQATTGRQREGRDRRRERRRERRERRVHRSGVPPPPLPSTTELVEPGPGAPPPPQHLGPHNAHLPDLLHSHVPPPYATLANGGGRPPLGGRLPPPGGPPPPIPLHVHQSGGPCGHLPPGAHLPPPGGPPQRPPGMPAPGSPVLIEGPWPFFGSRRSLGTPRGYLSDEEAKTCCGLIVTQAISIRWFIIMIAFVGMCCSLVGTVLGGVNRFSHEFITISLLMIGVGIVLMTVSGVAWHLTSRDAPCRVMLGLAPQDPQHPNSRRFITRMPPPFGRPHHPYAAMMYPEFGFRPPPPTYQASMQEYRLRLLLLDRHHQHPMAHPYHTHNIRAMGVTMGQESNYSHPPSYHSREGSISQNPDMAPSNNPTGGGGVGGGGGGGGGGVVAAVHSRDPSNLSFLSESIYSQGTHPSQNGSQRHVSVILDGNKVLRLHGSTSVRGINKKKNKHRDDNAVTIVQTTDSSQVIGSDAVIVTVSGADVRSIATHSVHQRHHNQQHHNQQQNDHERELSVLAHL